MRGRPGREGKEMHLSTYLPVLNVCVPPDSYVEFLATSVFVLETGPLKR